MPISRINILFTVLSIGLATCCPLPKLTDKTQMIKAEKIKTQETRQKEPIAIVMPFVISGEISDYNLIKRLRDSLFDTHILPGQYKRNAQSGAGDIFLGLTLYFKSFKR